MPISTGLMTKHTTIELKARIKGQTMCGSCTNNQALKILSDDVRKRLKMKEVGCSPYRYLYLREAPEFIPALNRMIRSLAQKRLPFFSEIPHKVMLFRGLEILLEKGFDSPEYQTLLNKASFRDAIVALCSPETMNEFAAATDGLNIEQLGNLFDIETYFCNNKLNSAVMTSECRRLLEHYVSWWLQGEGLGKNDLLAMMEETGIMDPINDVTDADRTRFALLCRAVYFSILVIGRTAEGKQLLLAIAQKWPAGVSFFDGDDLWLQRVATLRLYDLEGFEPFLGYLTSICASNYYFLDLVRNFSTKQKKLLLEEAIRYPEDETRDNFMSVRGVFGENHCESQKAPKLASSLIITDYDDQYDIPPFLRT